MMIRLSASKEMIEHINNEITKCGIAPIMMKKYYGVSFTTFSRNTDGELSLLMYKQPKHNEFYIVNKEDVNYLLPVTNLDSCIADLKTIDDSIETVPVRIITLTKEEDPAIFKGEQVGKLKIRLIKEEYDILQKMLDNDSVSIHATPESGTNIGTLTRYNSGKYKLAFHALSFAPVTFPLNTILSMVKVDKDGHGTVGFAPVAIPIYGRDSSKFDFRIIEVEIDSPLAQPVHKLEPLSMLFSNEVVQSMISEEYVENCERVDCINDYKLTEECGELIAILSKVMSNRANYDDVGDKLTTEVADVIITVAGFIGRNEIDVSAVLKEIEYKLNRFKKYQ